MLPSLIQLLERDLNKLEDEIKLYKDEDTLWVVKADIKNSAGNLCLHLCGNLRHFIGFVLSGLDYQRDRDFEFSAKGISRDKLLFEIGDTRRKVKEALSGLSPEKLETLYPQEPLGYPMTIAFFLVHLTAHLSYHLGQINYHRRILG